MCDCFGWCWGGGANERRPLVGGGAVGPLEERAGELEHEARAKLLGCPGLWLLLGGGTKVDEAADLYVKAANTYKMARDVGREAGDCFERVAALAGRDSRHEAATQHINAATCYRKVWPNGCVESLKKAVECFTDEGRFALAAKQQMAIGELYEHELADYAKACAAYEQAALWFEGEDARSAAHKGYGRVGLLAAQLGDYPYAADVFEKIGLEAMDDPLLKWGARDHFLKAGLCRLCMEDLVGTRLAMAKYRAQCQMWPDSRECLFLEALVDACEGGDVLAFTQAVGAYDAVTRLDNWATHMLLVTKRLLSDMAQPLQ